ncbi:MAG: tetratricopeptide repeat protein [Bacteroidia bacterium]|nr:tetratricopeptide repeat protein [Bacteroidia bacterium]
MILISKYLQKMIHFKLLFFIGILLLHWIPAFPQTQQLKEVASTQAVILRIKGTVLTDNQKLKDATITLLQDNKKIKTVTSNKEGLFTLDLELQKEFVIEISKKGFVTQKLKISTLVPEKQVKGDTWWSCKLTVNLFDMLEGLNTEALNNPVLQVKYFPDKDDFKIDDIYSKNVKGKIDETIKQVNTLKKQVFDKYLKDADKLIAEKKYEEAWLLYSRAKNLLPKETAANEKIEKVRKNIKVTADKGYSVAIEKAKKFQAEKNIESARNYYEIALLYKENDETALTGLENLEPGKITATTDNSDNETKLDKSSEENIIRKIDTYKKQLKVMEKENNRRSVAAILDSIGNLYRMQSAHEDAVKYYSDAIKVKEELGDKKDVAKILGKEAKVYMEMGQYDKTLESYEKALKISEESNDKTEVANILGNMANIYGYTYRTDDALKAYEKLVAVKSDLGDNKGASDALSNIGDIYLAKQNADKAIENYSKSLKMDVDAKDKKGQAANYNNLGIAFHKKGDYKKSVENHEKALALFHELNDQVGISKTYNNIGNNYYKMKEFPKAFDYYDKALKITRDQKDEKGEVSALYNIGNMYKEQKQFNKALENYNKSIELAKKISYQDALGKNYRSMSSVYYELKDFQKAYDHFKFYVDAKFVEDEDEQLSEVQTKMESDLEIQKLRTKLSKQEFVSKLKDEKARKDIELRDMELQKKDAEVKKQRILIFSFVAGFVIIAFFLIMIFRQYKQIKKANKLLARQNEEIMQQKEEIEAQRDQLELQNIELEKLSIVARETDNAVMIMDGKGKFEWVNAGFVRLFGINLEQLISEKGDNFLDTSASPDAKDFFQSCLEDKITVAYDTFTFDAKGQKIWTQTTLTPIVGAEGEIIKLVAIDSNITQIKIAEEEIKQQNEEIKAQSELLKEAYKQLEKKNVQIMDSINYAKRIQEAILPRFSLIKQYLPESFVLFKPKDVVSGDFYWFSHQDEKIFIAAVDCTGHGVPGAFMSMIGNTLMNEIVNKKRIFKPSEILLELNKGISFSLTQGKEGEDTQDDGMDISVCCIEKNKKEATLALAGHSAYVVKNGTIETIEGDIYSIGGMFSDNANVQYTDHTIKIDGDLSIYMNSDGYQDQFGGADNKKFMASRVSKMLLENRALDMEDQRKLLDATIEEWKGPRKQLDDILVIGIRLNPDNLVG